MKKTTVTGLEEKWEVFLVYIVSLLGFIFAFMKYDYLSEDIKFHYRQSGTIWLVNVVINIAASILGGIIGTGILTIVKAFEGTRYEIPVISDLAKSIWK